MVDSIENNNEQLEVFTVKLKRELPFEVGKKYKTKFASETYFIITKIDTNKIGNPTKFWGEYPDTNCGLCPLNTDRLIPEHTYVEKEVKFEEIIGWFLAQNKLNKLFNEYLKSIGCKVNMLGLKVDATHDSK